MKISDVLALKLAGYSVDDIKTITELSQSDPEVVSVAKQVKSMDELKSLLELSEVTAPAPQSTDKGKSDPEADAAKDNAAGLSEELEAQKAKVKELEEKLTQAQNFNRSKDNSGGEDAYQMAEDQMIDFVNNL